MFEFNNDDSPLPGEQEIEISDVPGIDSGSGKVPLIRRISLAPRFSSRQRRQQAITTGVVILIALTILLAITSSVRNLVVTQFSGSSTKQEVLTGSNLFYFQDLPSWGTIYVDDKPLAKAPTVDSAPPTRLPTGFHRITWRAEPFKSLSCTLVIPPDPERQSCTTRATGTNEYTRDATLIEFPITPSLDLLSVSQQHALVQKTQELLDQLQSTTTLQKGEYYTYNQDVHSPEIATRPLQAKLRFLLDTNTTTSGRCIGPNFGAACSIGENDCRSFCTLSWPQNGATSATPVWHIAAVVRPTWHYSSQDEVASFPSSTSMMGDQYFATFRVEWKQGKWFVSFHRQGTSSFDDPNCIAAIGMIISNPSYLLIERTQQRVTWTFSSGANRADGCLARATLHDSTMQLPLSQDSEAYILYRFGVLVSADDSAHLLWSQLPQGSQATQDIALNIARQPAFVS